MGRRRPLAIRWPKKGLTAPPGENRGFTKEKTAWVRDSLCLKWWGVVRAGVNQYPSDLPTVVGWKSCSSRSIGAVEGGVLWLAVG